MHLSHFFPQDRRLKSVSPFFQKRWRKYNINAALKRTELESGQEASVAVSGMFSQSERDAFQDTAAVRSPCVLTAWWFLCPEVCSDLGPLLPVCWIVTSRSAVSPCRPQWTKQWWNVIASGPREVVEVQSLEMFKIRLHGALSSLTQFKMSAYCREVRLNDL